MNREQFLKKLPGLPADQQFLLEFAYDIAKEGHGYVKQVRDDGVRYFDHPRAVAVILIDEFGVRDIPTIIMALLHDMPEDVPIWKVPGRITHIFGSEVGPGVHALAKPDKKAFPTKVEHLQYYFTNLTQFGWKVPLVKIADRVHNLSGMETWEPRRVQNYHEETREYFVPLIELVGTHSVAMSSKAVRLLESKVGPLAV
jgi:guanosine-3',5'-bis(diphosphate) 3'-pyrophosphohydrolase